MGIRKSQKMVLVTFTIASGTEYGRISQIFQIISHLPFEQPGERIDPAKAGKQFGQDNIYGVSLPGMSLLVDKDFLQLPFGM